MASKIKSITKKFTIDTTKPLVKDFVDADQALIRFIETMLPHQKKSKPKINHLYTRQNISRYRINWYEDVDGVMALKKMTASRYIQIESTESGLKITDQTI